MKIHYMPLYIVSIIFSMYSTYAQNKDQVSIHNVLRVNFVNPALEYEIRTGNRSAVSIGAGMGYGGSYRELEIQEANGLSYIISPFLDVQHKWFYNREKRVGLGKNIAFNSGNFISLRGISRFSSLAENVVRTDNIDFAIGPTWGLQRAFGKLHFLFDVGPQYYFDSTGNNGFFPLMVQINLGYNLNSK